MDAIEGERVLGSDVFGNARLRFDPALGPVLDVPEIPDVIGDDEADATPAFGLALGSADSPWIEVQEAAPLYRGDRPVRVLVVCTANICRSPVAAALLERHLAHRGVAAEVRSAGFGGGSRAADRMTVAAAAEMGIDIGGHRSRRVTKEIIDTEGHDLVIAMTRAQVRSLVAVQPSAWPRTSNLKDLTERLRARERPHFVHAEVASWIAEVNFGRKVADLLKSPPAFEVVDVSGKPLEDHRVMCRDLDAHTASLAASLAYALGVRSHRSGAVTSSHLSADPGRYAHGTR